MGKWAAAMLLTLASTGIARAEPLFAARTGLGCASCHLNRTGGGGRTAYGAGYGAQTLPWKKLAPAHGLFDGAVGERVRIGFDGRGGYLATFRDAGPYIGEAKLQEADVYFGADLIKDTLSIYIDEHVAPGGASSREAFALYAIERAGFYVKGEVLPPLRSSLSRRRNRNASHDGVHVRNGGHRCRAGYGRRQVVDLVCDHERHVRRR
jgi:hypothetical protein